MKFLDPLVVQWTGNNRWVLHNELRCISTKGTTFYIPAGFETDLASIPQIIQNLLSPTGPWARASVLHDWLYDRRILPREECDDLFYEAMIDDGVEKGLAKALYFAVKAFGERTYET